MNIEDYERAVKDLQHIDPRIPAEIAQQMTNLLLSTNLIDSIQFGKASILE